MSVRIIAGHTGWFLIGHLLKGSQKLSSLYLRGQSARKGGIILHQVKVDGVGDESPSFLQVIPYFKISPLRLYFFMKNAKE
jgi:hypothetical protein